MNIYKLKVLLKEFSFLEEFLKVSPEDSKHVKDDPDFWLTNWRARYGARLDFTVQLKGDYAIPFYTRVPDSCVIKRGDVNLLTQTPKHDTFTYYCDFGPDTYTAYYAVVGNSIIRFESDGVHTRGDGERIIDDAPNLGEQLAKMKIRPDYIICEDYLEPSSGSNGHLVITIYKMDKFDLADYHCQQIERAAKELKAELRIACG
jgi:hypothetical protein